MRVGGAIVLHELQERGRDRWVLVVSGLFALLSVGIAAYGRSIDDVGAVVTGPSLVTLATFLVPLVALVLGHDAIVGERAGHTLGLLFSLPVRRSTVLVSKYLGRLVALVLAVVLGLGLASLFMGPGQRQVLLALAPWTILLGASFLSMGIWLSTVARRVSSAASYSVVLWFFLVFFYDLALLGILVVTDGAISQDVIAWVVTVNPAGLYRTALMYQLLGDATMTELGLSVVLPGAASRAGIWAAWIVLPLVLGAVHLERSKGVGK